LSHSLEKEVAAMKVYNYTPDECGIDEFESGTLRLAGFEETKIPAEADVFAVPRMMYWMGVEKIKALPYLKGNEERHAMFCVADWFRQPLGIPAMMFRCDCTKWIKAQDPTTIPWAWPVDDLGEWVDLPFERDVVFQGWSSTNMTHVVCKSVQESALSAHIQIHDFFYGYEDESQPSTQELRETFLRSMATSRLSLCARSIPEGIARYRFYEALSMGRVPVHFCDNCVLPFADRIDYDRCTIHLPESEAPRTGEILTQWLKDHDDDEIRAMGAYGREMWARWLDSNHWDELFAEVVRERLG